MLKPSLKCNFDCAFCSAKLLSQKNQTVVTKQLKENIIAINPDNIIITGGDPLLLPVKYFYDLLSINDTITLSLTSNLWEFYNNPDKWLDLLKNPRIKVCTSFQYGNLRRINKNLIYSEDLFKKVVNKFNDKIGYVPSFISVISKENEKEAIKHVYLAKELNTKCRLNGMLPLGYSKEYYPRYKMIEIYLKILDLGLEAYENNTEQRKEGNCPFNTVKRCCELNRALSLTKNNQYVYSYCEDLLEFNYYEDLKDIPTTDTSFFTDLINPKQCLNCELCNFCNGCKLHRKFAKLDKDYCRNMKALIQKIKNAGFKI